MLLDSVLFRLLNFPFFLYFFLLLHKEKSETVPSVQIMMNGGIRSMQLVKANLRWDKRNDESSTQHHIMPIVVVKDSGRLSSCLARAMEIFHVHSKQGRNMNILIVDFHYLDRNLHCIGQQITL